MQPPHNTPPTPKKDRKGEQGKDGMCGWVGLGGEGGLVASSALITIVICFSLQVTSLRLRTNQFSLLRLMSHMAITEESGRSELTCCLQHIGPLQKARCPSLPLLEGSQRSELTADFATDEHVPKSWPSSKMRNQFIAVTVEESNTSQKQKKFRSWKDVSKRS